LPAFTPHLHRIYPAVSAGRGGPEKRKLESRRMLALRVIWVGRSKRGFSQDAVDHYCKRIRALGSLECIEIRAASHSGRDEKAAIKAESDAILKRLGKRGAVLLLDERGRQPTSRELADQLGALGSAGGVTFVMGGAYGVDERVRACAGEVISLSRLTFPHQLARVVLLEQIYRALTLRAGHGYHHG